jgi:gliding motility-associated lipoprotein GldH
MNFRKFGIILFLAISLLQLSSCQKAEFREFHKFENYTWGRFNPVTFNVPVEKEMNVDIIVTFRHLDQFPYDEIPMYIVMTTPYGEERILDRTLSVKDENGKFKGSVAGNQWDIEEILWKNFYFNQKGTYKIVIENINPRMGMVGLIDLGLIVRKTTK